MKNENWVFEHSTGIVRTAGTFWERGIPLCDLRTLENRAGVGDVMAAAPALLAAAQTALAVFERGNLHSAENTALLQETAANVLRAAIAKAAGYQVS